MTPSVLLMLPSNHSVHCKKNCVIALCLLLKAASKRFFLRNVCFLCLTGVESRGTDRWVQPGGARCSLGRSVPTLVTAGGRVAARPTLGEAGPPLPLAAWSPALCLSGARVRGGLGGCPRDESCSSCGLISQTHPRFLGKVGQGPLSRLLSRRQADFCVWL